MSKCVGETLGDVHALYPEFGVSDLEGEARRGKRRINKGNASGNTLVPNFDRRHVSIIDQEHTR